MPYKPMKSGSFKKIHSNLYNEERMEMSVDDMTERLNKHYPHKVHISAWSGDWGMGHAVYTMHLPDPATSPYSYGMAISHYKSANSPVGFNPSLFEFLELECDVTPEGIRAWAKALNDYADIMDAPVERVEGSPRDDTPISES